MITALAPYDVNALGFAAEVAHLKCRELTKSRTGEESGRHDCAEIDRRRLNELQCLSIRQKPNLRSIDFPKRFDCFPGGSRRYSMFLVRVIQAGF